MFIYPEKPLIHLHLTFLLRFTGRHSKTLGPRNYQRNWYIQFSISSFQCSNLPWRVLDCCWVIILLVFFILKFYLLFFFHRLENNHIEVTNLINSEAKYQLHMHENCVLSMKFANNSKWFISTSRDKSIIARRSPFGPSIFQVSRSSSLSDYFLVYIGMKVNICFLVSRTKRSIEC